MTGIWDVRRWSLRGTALAGMAAALVAPAAGAAHAQTLQSTLLGPIIPDDYSRGRNVSVSERPRPEYDPVGLRLGAFFAYPQVSVGAGYNDNVFGAQTNTTSDEFFAIDPDISVRSNWSNHEVDISAGARLREYLTESSENEQGWFLIGNGRLDVNRDNQIHAGFSVQKLYEERSSGSYPVGAAAPVGLMAYTASLRATHEGGRIRASLATDINVFDYDNVPSLTGGEIDQNSRDRSTWRTSARGEFALTPDTSVFGTMTYSRTSYRLGIADNLPDRDSNEYRFLTGATFDLTALTRGVIGVGYIYRAYSDPRLDSLGGFSVDGQLEYFPTQLLTITLSGRRLIEDSVSTDITGVNFVSGGYFNNAVALRADYELLRNVILNARAQAEIDQFNGFDREDHINTFGLGAKYLANRSLRFTADLNYLDRSSSGTSQGLKFNEFQFLVGASLGL